MIGWDCISNRGLGYPFFITDKLYLYFMLRKYKIMYKYVSINEWGTIIMGKVVSFINMKGGVGKTTLCIGIAEYLAHFMNTKVLLIDLDPQFNTTQSIMNLYDLEEKYLDEYKKNKTVKRLFESSTTISDRPQVPTACDLIVELDDHMSIIPGTIDLIVEDKNNSSSRAKRLRKFIYENELLDQYEYIFIDCPPTISLYTDAALIASDFYLVPIKVDRYSILGVQLLNNVIEKLSYDEELNIIPLGKVYTMIDSITDKTQKIIDSIEDDEISKTITSFSTKTSFVRDLMVGNQGNFSSKYNKSEQDIKKICEEFKKRVEQYDK